MRLLFSFFTLLLVTVTFAQTKGTISGVLTDKEMNNEVLPFANVTIKGTTIGVTTDEKGAYSLSVAPGKYTVVFAFLGYNTAFETAVVKAGENTVLNKALGSSSVQLEGVVLTTTKNRQKESVLLLEQKNAVEIKQAIGAQEMSRKGVSNVEQGLTKITGISKVGSRGIFVRGLEDRYNSLLVNGLYAPSNNPFRKIIPLDLFPTDIVSLIDVYKTFNPNIYGDFAGATFDIVTSTNSESKTKLSLGVGYTVNNNLSPFLLSEDANSTEGFLGLTANDRKIPGILGSVPSNRVLTTDESQKNFKTGWNVSKIQSPLNTSVGFLHSEKFKLANDRKFSYLLSLNTDNSYTQISGADNKFETNGDYYNKLIKSEFHYKTNTSALVALNFKTKRTNLTSNTFYLRSTDNMIQDQFGARANLLDKTNVIIRTNQLDQSDYLNTQLLADYALNENKSQLIKGGISFAKTSYQQPDRKILSGSLNKDGQATISYGGNNFLRQYLDIKSDFFTSSFMEYTLKFGGEDKHNKLSVGYNGNSSYTETSYRFIKTNGKIDENTQFTASINNIDNNINTDLALGNFDYQENTNVSFKTKLTENTNAGYGSLLLKFADSWEVTGGIRAERFYRDLRYRFVGKFVDPFDKSITDKLYFLPSINVKYSMNDKANIRFAASKNYTKPVTMEVLPISYINGDGTSIQGNPYLVNSDNINTDLKFEFFPSNKEIFVIGLFGKHIENPIERTFRGEAGGQITTFLNSEKADLYGIELEGILDLKRIHTNLSDFSLGFNTTIMQSKVTVKPFTIDPTTGKEIASAETHFNRELQGASKWLINSDLKYQFNVNKSWSNTVSLVYSVFGKRIYSVGSLGLDHIYELPIQQLDFVWNGKFSENYSLKLGVNNILNPLRQQIIGENHNPQLITFIADSNIVQEYRRGVGFSLTLNYTF